MHVKFKTRKLEHLYYDEKADHRYPTEVVESFFDAIGSIIAAVDERDLYALKGFHFEKLRGKRKEQYLIRLNNQFRLILTKEAITNYWLAVSRYLFLPCFALHIVCYCQVAYYIKDSPDKKILSRTTQPLICNYLQRT